MRGALFLLALASCSAAPQPQPQPQPQPGSPWEADQPGKCAERQWGGWDGTPECAELEARRIAGADRACATDADCVRPSGGNCDDNVLSTTAAPRYADWPAPCNDPHAGDCSPSHAACLSGCCASWND